MKKAILIVFFTIFAVCQAYAQSLDETAPTPADELSLTEADESSAQQTSKQSSKQVSDLFIDNLTEDKADSLSSDYSVLVPIRGKSAFMRRHYTYQTVEVSTIAGHDKDKDDTQNASATNASKDDIPGADISPQDIASAVNVGLNIGYSFIFVPGQIQGDKLAINRFGFAYSTGFIAAFDRQDKYDVTCDFLVKLGVETGNGHALGIGIDGLVGGGKSPGILYFLDDPTSEGYSYTAWCFKYGAQVWLKTNLLTTSIKNTDILAFARFVRSENPYDDNALLEMQMQNFWIEESWQFGVTLRYRF